LFDLRIEAAATMTQTSGRKNALRQLVKVKRRMKKCLRKQRNSCMSMNEEKSI
jgi:hypothetical protein